jgi:hypothetical protein
VKTLFIVLALLIATLAARAEEWVVLRNLLKRVNPRRRESLSIQRVFHAWCVSVWQVFRE